MPVNVVDGDKDEDYVVQQRRFGFGDCDVAQQRQAGILSVHLAGMNRVLDQQNRAARGVNSGRIENPVLRDDDNLQIAPLTGLAEVFDSHLAGRGGGNAFQVGDGFGVIRRGAVAADLGRCAPVGGLGTEAERRRDKESGGKKCWNTQTHLEITSGKTGSYESIR